MSYDHHRDTAELDRMVDMMRARIDELIHSVWGLKGHRNGVNFVCPNPLRGDRSEGSFVIAVAGKFQGMVTDFAGEAIPGGGKQSVSPLNFHIALMHKGDKKAAVDWAKDWLGLSGRSPEALKATRAAISKFDERPAESEEDIKKKRDRAKRIYLKDTLAWPGTPADLYYRGRGLDLSRLPFPAGAPRFKAKCFCGELGKPGNDAAAYLPAIILPYHAPDGQFLAVHRTYLGQDDAGRWIKHPALKKTKPSYAPYAGGFIPLWAGTRVLERTGVIAHGQSLGKTKSPVRIHICEGPEDGWSVALAHSDERVVAAGSVSNMGGIAFGDNVTEIVIWKQADPPGSPADQAFRRAVRNFQDQDKIVMIADVTSVVPGVKDANDVVRLGADRPAAEGGLQ